MDTNDEGIGPISPFRTVSPVGDKESTKTNEALDSPKSKRKRTESKSKRKRVVFINNNAIAIS